MVTSHVYVKLNLWFKQFLNAILNQPESLINKI